MSEKVTKSINFAGSEGLTEKYWAKISVSPFGSDLVSLEDAATVIDAIYDVTPCSSDSALVGGQPAIQIEPDDVLPVLSAAFGAIGYDPCKYNSGAYSYDVVLHIYRSHYSIPYKLVINDGSILNTERIEKTISTLVLPNNKQIETEFYIAGDIECDYEIVSFSGSQALLKYDISKNITFSFTTVYDKVTIRINGTETEAQDAECLLFYKELVYSETISQPEEDAGAVGELGCNPTNINGVETDDVDTEDGDEWSTPTGGSCYQRIIYSQICQCSGNTKDSVSVVSQVPCPDSPATPHSDTAQGALNFWWQAKNINSYVHCPDDPKWEGSEVDYYLDTCCYITPGIWPPGCQERTISWPGGVGIIKGPDFYTGNALRGESIKIVPVGPPDGICGTIKYVQNVVNRNCCDNEFYEDILIDAENSVEVMGKNAVGVVYWTKGEPPYDISVRGSGYSLFGGGTNGTTVSRHAIIVTDDDACGTGTFSVNDGCSDGNHNIRSTDGQWVFKDECANETGTGCGGFIAYSTDPDGVIIKNKYKIYDEVVCIICSNAEGCGPTEGCSEFGDNCNCQARCCGCACGDAITALTAMNCASGSQSFSVCEGGRGGYKQDEWEC